MGKALLDTDALSEIASLALVHGLVAVPGNFDHHTRIARIGYALEIENWLRP